RAACRRRDDLPRHARPALAGAGAASHPPLRRTAGGRARRGLVAKYLTAAEAAARLGVHRSTLYAYVSRGRLRAEPDPASAHASRYAIADVERLRDRKEARLRPAEAARKTLHFGLPVLQSGITLIADGRLFYRGQDAIVLARTSTFERVIE